uniref:Sodium/potassium-transporting ATPase subunit beta-1-interacting protein n=1 Tax=Ditylenchus dipsaci TaxID=166011 RepID=A0A915DUH1_9BILA
MSSAADFSTKNHHASLNYSQKWLIVLLFIWLFLTIARQAFDLIGKLWIPVAFNLLQLLACISGLFAAFQCRFGLLISLSISTLVSLTYNTLLLLWYTNWLGDRESAVLSAGLPFGHSFFLRHTPLCGSHFNLTTSKWQQSSDCVLPYYHLEGIQASIHMVVAVLTLFLSILTLVGGSRPPVGKEKKSIRGQGLQIAAPDSINDLSSGYMNSSYESPVEGGGTRASAGVSGGARRPFSSKAPMLANSQRRVIPNNSRRQKKGLSQKESKPVQANTLVDEYSSATTADLAGSSNSSTDSQSLPLPPAMPPPPTTNHTNYSSRIYARAQHANGSTRYSKAAASHQMPRAQSSMGTTADQNEEEEVYVSPTQAIKQISSPYYSHPKHVKKLGGSLRGPVAPAPDSANTSGYLEYLGSERRNSATNLTSLVSFDPKSNTLIRVREHQNDSSDEAEDMGVKELGSGLTEEVRMIDYVVSGRLNTGSQDSMPSIKAPVLTPNFRASTSKNQNSQPLRQRMPPPGIDLQHPASEYQNPDHRPESPNNPSPDWSQAVLNTPNPVNNSIYECVGGHRPVPSTAFPVTHHERQRSVTGISVASAITLTRPMDRVVHQQSAVPNSSHYTSTFVGANQRNSNSTTFPNSYLDVRDSKAFSNPAIFPTNDGNGNGLLV